MKKRLLALALTAAMVGMTACSGGAKETTPAPAAETTAAAPAETKAPETAAPETTAAPAAETTAAPETVAEATTGEKKEIEELKIGVGAMSTNFVPAKDMGIQALRVMYNVHDKLIYVDEEGNFGPQLAESWSYVDDKTFEVKLRKDAKFHNGDPVTANDVKFSADLAINGELGTAVTIVIEPVESVEVVDDYTARFHLKWADTIMETRLSASRTLYIMPEKYYNEVGGLDGYNAAPIGCGPFKVKEIMQGEQVVLERFDDYWGEKPYVKTVRYIKYGEDSTRMTALLNNEVDVINDINNDLRSNFEGVPNIETCVTSVPIFHLFIYNTVSGPTANKQLRQAMNMAIDRDLLVETLWGEGAKVPQNWQFEEFGDTFLADYPGVEYDPEKAKQLVAESGYDGTEIEYQIVPGYYMNDLAAAQVCVDMWKQIGVNVQIVNKEKLEREFPGLRMWSCAIRFNDVLGGPWMQFPDGAVMKIQWPNPPQAIYDAGEKMKTGATVEERREGAKEYMDVLNEEVPVSYLYLPEEIWGYRLEKNFHWNEYWTKFQIFSLRAEDFWGQ